MNEATVFEDSGGWAAAIAGGFRRVSPRVLAALIALAGFAVMSIVLVGLGLLLVHVLIHGVVGTWDQTGNRWLAAHRTSTWNTVTDVGSILAGTGTVLAVAGVAATVMVFRRLWWEIAFWLVTFFVEFGTFLVTVMLVSRARPDVPRLDGTPATSSFPSGHVAAAIVLYCGLALIITTHTRHAALRIVAWAIALLFVADVGFSRVYRGLHHPTDVVAGVVLGIGAVLFGILAVRAADAASKRRRRRTVDTPSLPERSGVRA